MIRLLASRTLGILLLLAFFPFAPLQQIGNAKSPKQVCKDRCSSAYHFCLNRALNSKGRADCKTARSQCRGMCSGNTAK